MPIWNKISPHIEQTHKAGLETALFVLKGTAYTFRGGNCQLFGLTSEKGSTVKGKNLLPEVLLSVHESKPEVTKIASFF